MMTVMGKEENKTRKRKHSHFRFGFGAFITNMNNDDAKERENAHLSPVFKAPTQTRALWISACLKHSSRRKIILLMRSAERMDRVFGDDWTSTEIKNGKLCRTDANMPLDIRALKYSTLCNDSPITPFGRFTCALIGRALRNRHIIPDRIVCAPALRAVQSASVIAEMLHMSVTVDHDLCEPRAWYTKAFSSDNSEVDPPKHLKYDDLIRCGFPILPKKNGDNDVVVDGSIHHNKDQECEVNNKPKAKEAERTEDQGMKRIEEALKKWFHRPRDGPLLIVGHAITLRIGLKIAAESQEIINVDRKCRSAFSSVQRALNSSKSETCGLSTTDFYELGRQFPYSCVVALAQQSKQSEGVLATALEEAKNRRLLKKNDRENTPLNRGVKKPTEQKSIFYELPSLIPAFSVAQNCSNEVDMRV